jgi:Thioredoxin like C-terminal domain
MSTAQSGQPSEWARFLTRANQLVRQPGPVTERTFEISFLDPGVQAYAFTFG